jgi:hypothetical protein
MVYIEGGERSCNFICLTASTVVAASYRSLELPRTATSALDVNPRIQIFERLLSTKQVSHLAE